MTGSDLDRQVVITGVGVVSPIGIGRGAFWRSLEESKTGIQHLGGSEMAGSLAQIGGLVEGFDSKSFVKPRKSIKLMCREIQFGLGAAGLAVADAKLDTQVINSEKFGVVFGSELLYGDPRETEDLFRACLNDDQFSIDSFGRHLLAQLFPLWMLRYLPNMVACHVGIAHNACGHNNTVVSGEVSSLLAVIEGAIKIEKGAADVMIVGGIGALTSFTRQAIAGTDRLSNRIEQPAAASRPFDAGRDGLVISEGSGALVLESRRHAGERGARSLAKVCGFSRGFAPPPDVLSPSRDAIHRSIESALANARMNAGDLAHVNAHGASEVVADRVESHAIRDAIGDVPVTAPKSLIGHMGAGGGAVEAVATVLSLEKRLVPPTLNYETPDPECPVNVVHGLPLATDKPAAMLLNHTISGQAVAVVVARD